MDVRIAPMGASVAVHTPRKRCGSTFGTLRLIAVRAGAVASQLAARFASSVAVRQRISRPISMLTARPDSPQATAVSAAPTVPECNVERPVLKPGFTPATTSSGGGPNAPSTPAMTHKAGAPSSAYAGDPQPAISTASYWISSLRAAIDAELPLISWRGATTTTSKPASRIAHAR